MRQHLNTAFAKLRHSPPSSAIAASTFFFGDGAFNCDVTRLLGLAGNTSDEVTGQISKRGSQSYLDGIGRGGGSSRGG